MKAMKRPVHFWLVCLLFWVVGLPYAITQTDKALLRELAEDNKKSIEALVLYPQDARLAILEATKYPEALIKMRSIREKTAAAFRTLIEDFPKSTQTIFYDLTRYPGLIEGVVAQQEDRASVARLLEVLPESERSEAARLVDQHPATLLKINELNHTSQGAFDGLIAAYPTPAQAAFRQLLDLPEVIDILNEDLRFTVLVGDTYRSDPAWVIYKMDSLNLAVARTHAEELDNWKVTLDKDPAARQELADASQEYSSEYGYTNENYVNDDLYDDYHDTDRPLAEHHYYHHYPYWYGYPWWEPYPRWWPYPYWWDWGCHYNHGTVVVVYLPSYHFMHWYFDHPRHHERYNHLSTQFVNHYNGHRHSGTNISMGVADWHERNRTVISEEFLKDKSRLPGRLKEYGQFEQGRETFNARNPNQQVTPEEYLQKNGRKYPELQTSSKQAQKDIQQEREQVDRKRSDWAPVKEPVTREPEPQRPPRVTQPTQKPVTPTRKEPDIKQPAPTEKPRQTDPKPRKDNPVETAKDYHRQQWESEKPRQTTPPPRQVTPAPKPQTQAPKAPAPARNTSPAPKTETPKKRGG